MSLLDQISVLILTYNEEPNIGRTLAALARFTDIVVLDSGSTDRTRDIVARFPNARLVTRSFDEHATQWNHGLQNCGIERPWVLALDADYLLPDALVDEIAALQPADAQAGYEVAFRYCIHGRRLSASLYPGHVVLYRRDQARYVQEGHTQRVVVEGWIGALRARIDHDDRKPLARWLSSQQRYARLEADHLLSVRRTSLRWVDRIRLTGILGPCLVFLYTLFAKRCILDGWPGWLYVLQRTVAETMIAAELIDHKLKSPSATLRESRAQASTGSKKR
ncbi:MAG: glycosyl transferase [Methylocystaceae bacterium]|nr:MAG: glycosyl transferase [Methylocystaceae bacterium]